MMLGSISDPLKNKFLTLILIYIYIYCVFVRLRNFA